MKKKIFPYLYFYICDIKDKKYPKLRGSLVYESKNPIDRKIRVSVLYKYDVLMTEANTAKKAKDIIDKFIKRQKKVNISILPTILNFQDLRDLINSVRSQGKGMHWINAQFYTGREELKTNRLQCELDRSIHKNRSWTRKLEKLEGKTKRYKKTPNRKLKLEILNDMYRLGIEPNGMII